MPFASIWLGLGLALTSTIGRYRLTLKTYAVPGTQQLGQVDAKKRCNLPKTFGKEENTHGD
jgi:hypothetical protein